MIETAIVLAAGSGSRLRPLTNNIPKCLIKIKGKEILLGALDHLAACGIKEVVIVVGYLQQKVREAVGTTYKGMQVSYIHNESYDRTNNMYSLWLARETLQEGALVLEGDLVFEEAVMHKVLNTTSGSCWAVDKFNLFKDGCMLTSDEHGSIVGIEIVRRKGDQDVQYTDQQHKSGAILRLQPELGALLADWLDFEVRHGNVQWYYDLVLAKYLEQSQISVCNINGLRWMEVDDYGDLRAAEKVFSDSAGGFEMKYELVPIERLRPLERVFPNHLDNLNKRILKESVIKAPLLVDRNTGIVLDGSHRYVFFLMHGYKTVPVQFVDYNDENIRVGTHLLHRHLIVDQTNISKADVVERGLSGALYPPRTTRHFFPFRKLDDIDLPLSQLEKGEPRDVQPFIEEINIDEEIKHNDGFIQEIDQEIDEVINYLYESRKVKEYLKFQVEEMKKKVRQGIAVTADKR